MPTNQLYVPSRFAEAPINAHGNCRLQRIGDFERADNESGIVSKQPAEFDTEGYSVFTGLDENKLREITTDLHNIGIKVEGQSSSDWQLPLYALTNSEHGDLETVRGIFASHLNEHSAWPYLESIVQECINYAEIQRRIELHGLENDPSNPFIKVMGMGIIHTHLDELAVSLRMEELDGYSDLDKYIQGIMGDSSPFADQPQKYLAMEKLFDSLAEAFEFCAKLGVSHRDLKPSNIMVSADGKVKIVDLATAHFNGKPSVRLAKAGTNNYIPPEFFASFNVEDGLERLTKEELISEIITLQAGLDYAKFDTFSMAMGVMQMLGGDVPHNRGDLSGGDRKVALQNALDKDLYLRECFRMMTGFTESAILGLHNMLNQQDSHTIAMVEILTRGCTYSTQDRTHSPAQLCKEIAWAFASFNTV